MEPELVSFTILVTPTRADIFDVYKCGKLCQVCINNLVYDSYMTSDTAVATGLPAAKQFTRFLLYQVGYNGESNIHGYVNKDGTLVFNKTIGSYLTYGSFTYFCE